MSVVALMICCISRMVWATVDHDSEHQLLFKCDVAGNMGT